VLRFQHGDDPPIIEKVIVREGEKNRLLQVRLPELPAKALAVAPIEGEHTSPPVVPIVAFSLIGAGAALLGLGAYFEVTQVNDLSTLRSTCGVTASCKQSDVDTISHDRVYGGLAIGAGAAAAGAGAVLLLIRPSSRDSPARTGMDVVPARGGGALLLRGSF